MTAPPTTMGEHSFCVQWRFVVPPDNTFRIVVMQRRDGPFRKDLIGGAGHYYTSVEAYHSIEGRWNHMPGSSSGGYASFESAMQAAEGMWRAAAPKVIGVAA